MNRDFNKIKIWLTPLLKERQITVENLSVKSGVSRAAIYAYLKDRNRPDEQTMAKLVHTLSELPVWKDGKETFQEITLEEGLAQYTPKSVGRPKGSYGRPREVRVRQV